MNSSIKEKKDVSLGHFTVSVCPEKIYIKHHKSNKVIFISRIEFAISEVNNYDEVLNMKSYSDYQVDSILGIFNYDKKNKYLIVVTTSKIAAKFKGAYIYNISSVGFIKINFTEENKEEKMRINEVKNFLSSKNFYYSNDYDISKSLYVQDNEIDNNNYLINLLFMADFITYKVPKCFFSYVILGYIGCKIDIEINDAPSGQNKKLDLIIIERTHREYMLFKEEISRQLREIEFLSVYKLDQKEDCVFSTIVYLCNEIFYQNINSVFNPYHPFIKKELDNYEKIACVINDIYLNNDTSLTDFILKSNELKNKVLLVNQVKKDWKPGLYFESNNNCIEHIESYFQNAKYPQGKVIWFVDINNNMVDKNFMNEKCLKAIVRIFWIAIQKQMNNLKWNINIGLFSEENKTNLSLKYKDIIMPYFGDIGKKQILYKKELRNTVQKIYDLCFNRNPYNSNNFNSMSILESKKLSFSSKSSKGNISEKLNILCISWNVDDLPIEQNNIKLNIKDLFTQNILYQKRTLPDIIFISLQRILKLMKYDENTANLLHKKRLDLWTKQFQNYIQNLYSNCVYVPFKSADFVGNCFISFIKFDLQTKINFHDLNVIKYGIEPGNKGDKGFSYITFDYNGWFISVASAYFNSNFHNNNFRLQHLKQLLNTKINSGLDHDVTFKENNFWIIVGDFNFRVELDYEPVMALIEKNNTNFILNNDQFYKCKSMDSDFNLISEGNIMFRPTYKFMKGSNNYFNENMKKKIPSYTDRIFYGNKKGINSLYYNSINNILYSSHKPVIGCFEIILDE